MQAVTERKYSMKLLVVLAATSVATASTAKPNFVVLFVDDMGIDQIEVPKPANVYGYTGNNGKIKTPNLAKFASQGLLFQTWYSSFHVCSPSRASMMTGRYSIRSGVGIPNIIYAPDAPGPSSGGNCVFTAESIGGLPLNETTTAEALKKLGYATMALGKWHLGQRDIYLPTSRGFDEYLGIPFSQDMGISFWEPRGWKPAEPYFPSPLPLLNGTTVIEQPCGLHTVVKKYSKAAAGFIEKQAKAGTPFYLYVPYNHVHGPNSCGPDYCGKSSRGPIGDAVEEMDWSVGQIMASLESSGVDNNTLVFFSSDNGSPQRPDGNRPLRGYKATTWEGGFREPGMARWPGRIQPGESVRPSEEEASAFKFTQYSTLKFSVDRFQPGSKCMTYDSSNQPDRCTSLLACSFD
jgi:arylsulfatase A-like enzyme